MSIRELKEYTTISKYAKYLPDEKRRENWNECVDRVKGMMLERYKDCPEVHDDLNWAYEMMRKKRVLGSQRALQFGGEPILKRNLRLYNCISSYVDRPRFFQESIYLLLCGCGVGFSVQNHHIGKLPNLVKSIDGEIKHVIEDSIEGWSDAVGALVCSYFDQKDIFPEYVGKNVRFDFTRIRAKGEKITSGGKAPGPEPLKKALREIRKILSSAGGKKLRSIEAYDIIMHSADAVISGGVRRSATTAIFSPDDNDMAKAKTGNWLAENPQRGRSNNSALLLRGETSPEQFSALMKNVREFGEPGFAWSDSTELILNPCFEIGFWPVCEETGESGWQACNLSTVNCSKIQDEVEFYESCKAAAIIGTLQAGFTHSDYLGETTKRILERESLLGVSMTGIMEKSETTLSPIIQKEAAKLVKKTNKEIAKKIGINPAARTTCVKPEGTASCILGTSSGIHPHHAKRYIRRVQANRTENIYQHFKSINPRACESSVWSANDTDDVISFCIEVPTGSKTKNQISAIQLLETVKTTQKNWVTSGKDESLCTQPWLSHNVSNTINVKPDEWDEVESFIYKNRKWFCGVSLLPISGDKDYPQAPFTQIYLPSEMLSFYGDGSMFVSGLIEQGLELYDDNLWQACDAVLGSKTVKGKSKTDFVDRCVRFAGKYFDADIKKLTYAMKDVSNYKLWTELQMEYVNVDYSVVVEDEDNRDMISDPSCANGACEIVFT